MERKKGTGKAVERNGAGEMKGNSAKNKTTFAFTDAELAIAAEAVSNAMLHSLPEPEECKHEFSADFERKMEKLFVRERAMRRMAEIRRWAAAILLLVIIGGSAILAVDTEARAAFFGWVRKVYENSIVYEFFNEPTEGKLPTYDLGWVPEGYELTDAYRDETLYSAVYRKGEDIRDRFIYQYGYVHEGTKMELLLDLSEYEVKHIVLADKKVDLYISKNEAESSTAVWIDELSGIHFMIDGFFNESVMLHIIENVILVKMPK